MDIFGGYHKIGLYRGPGSFLCILGSFLKDKEQNRRYFFEIPDIYFGIILHFLVVLLELC